MSTIRGFSTLVRNGVDAVIAGIKELEEARATSSAPASAARTGGS